MNLRQLKTLIAVAEYGNLAKAADAIALTPSAVSQQMTSLEDEVGISLFDRSTRPPTLTYQGQQLLDAAKNIIQTADNVLDAIKGKNMSGAFNVGAVRTSIFGFLPRAISELKKDNPMLKIKLRMGRSDDLIYDVSAGRLDAAVVAEPQTILPKLEFTPFIEEPLYAISKPGHPYDNVEDLLTTQDYIRFSSNVPLAQIIDAELKKRNIFTKPTIEIDSIYGIIQCVVNGLGASIVPYTPITNPFPTNVFSLPFGNPHVVRRIGIVREVNTPKKVLINTLHERLAHLSGPFGKFRKETNE
ncbi:MAG: LysR substrate-binding domain-containing protein [Desulfuromonadales bacterium]|jgi:DNA-binding transcriptional LysR family regulator